MRISDWSSDLCSSDLLSHAAGNLVRIGAGDALRVSDAHRLQHLERTAPGLRVGHLLMRAVGLGDLLAHPHHRVQRELRVLHDHGDALAADASHLRLAGALQVDAVELQALRPDDAPLTHEAPDGAARTANYR